ncbi:hypothetical protein Q1695_004055 [Nippostrongylus brasiliensis]|nr:hypothetical protein Q1695_004055 [Nippostrongylus brasiliensis]
MGFHVFPATVPPAPLGDNKLRRGYYTRSILCDAVKQVMIGAMTVTQASRHFKIPRTTIQKHFSKAREQHTLKEMYIRRMEAMEEGGYSGRMPLENEPGQRLSESGAAYLEPYGADAWPREAHDIAPPVPIHWRRQPVRVEPQQALFIPQDRETYSFENEMVVAEQCEVVSNEVRIAEPVRISSSQEQADVPGSVNPPSSHFHAHQSGALPKRVTRVILKREGRNEEIVKEIVLLPLSTRP